MSNRAKAVLGVILVFILGVLSGMVASSIFAHRELVEFMKHPREHLMDAMERSLTKNLDLDADQKLQIHHYFVQNLLLHEQLQSQIQPQIQDLNHATIQQIRAALRPDQQKRLDQNLDDLRDRFWNYSNEQEQGNPAQPDAQTNAAPATTGAAEPPAKP